MCGFWVKLWMKSPTLFFPMSTQLAMVEKFLALLYGLLDILFSPLPLNSLLVWGSLLVAIPPLKTIWLVACGLLLLARCHNMAFLP
jgi:hypothetical protein